MRRRARRLAAVAVGILLTLGPIGPSRTSATAGPVGGRPVVVGLPQIQNLGLPALRDAPRYGEAATADPGTWTDPWRTGDEPIFRYRWLRDGKPIEGASSRRYRPTRTDVGRDLAVHITASGVGHRSATATSEAETVGRAVIGILETTENRRRREDGVRRGGSIELTFLLGREANGGRASAVLLDTVVGRAEVASGKLVIRLHTDRVPELQPGTRPFDIEYAGTAHAESASRSLWMLVR